MFVKGKRKICLDNDELEIETVFDEEIGKTVFDYPDFNLTPRITPGGRRWVNALSDDCPYADEFYGDCGSCDYFVSESPGDLIGICINEKTIDERDNKDEN